jgi:hypothetical protein
VHVREWLESTFPERWHRSQAFVRLANKGADIERAAWVVKETCQVTSRTELDTNVVAHTMFRDLIFTPYKEQREADGIE